MCSDKKDIENEIMLAIEGKRDEEINQMGISSMSCLNSRNFSQRYVPYAAAQMGRTQTFRADKGRCENWKLDERKGDAAGNDVLEKIKKIV